MSLFDKTVDHVNLGLTVMAFVFLSSVLFLKFSKPDSIERIMASTHNAAAEIPLLNVSKKSSKYYQRILGRRELFVAQPGLRLKKIGSQSPQQAGSQSVGDDLQLLGIVSGAQGPQAIIMDSKTGQSFYCSGGEKINDFTVRDILENKVILENDGEMKEIRL